MGGVSTGGSGERLKYVLQVDWTFDLVFFKFVSEDFDWG
jgi:hypothetical protein